eukprot:m51a1_g5415 hypothetical protein (395) ;mRNA; f:122663-123847
MQAQAHDRVIRAWSEGSVPGAPANAAPDSGVGVVRLIATRAILRSNPELFSAPDKTIKTLRTLTDFSDASLTEAKAIVRSAMNADPQNEPSGLYVFAVILAHNGNNAEAIKLLKAAAAHGHSPSLFFLGHNYETGGLGLQIDEAAAQTNYEEAASRGHASAEYNLALLLDRKCPSANSARVKSIFKRCAERGVSNAQYSLGMSLLQTLPERSLPFLNAAADQELAIAQHALGVIYERGFTVKKNPELALRYFRAAVAQDYAPSMVALATMLYRGESVRKDCETSARLLERASAMGDAGATTRLAALYLQGEGVAQDRDFAIDLLVKAANAGNNEAKTLLLKAKLTTREEEENAETTETTSLLTNTGLMAPLLPGRKRSSGSKWVNMIRSFSNSK